MQGATASKKMSAADGSLFDRFSLDTTKKYGEGGYGQTFAATYKSTGEALACKVFDSRRMKLDEITKETKILEVLQHENIIAPSAVNRTQTNLIPKAECSDTYVAQYASSGNRSSST